MHGVSPPYKGVGNPDCLPPSTPNNVHQTQTSGPSSSRDSRQTPNEECLFLERLEENHYNTYISKKHAEKNWFVGLKKNGSCKRGPRTHYGQKAILFLPLPVSSD
ncbi:putative fibroblast growth factor 1 [Saguinus oedipus]|uniref:Fibroblast growth factor 1 n=1 Tax=Saguinus oedipus TaxID=9490 RepID=A0ABQ9W524_SAGOE|nr:putative fibroblast growth factor 1 [Saguinus oedipus]